MQFDARHEKHKSTSDPAREGHSQSDSARPLPQGLADIGIGGPPDPIDPSVTIPTEVMSLIRRVARYHARIHEGLIRYKDDMGEAIRYARRCPEGMTEEEHEQANSVIGKNPDWSNLLTQLMGAAADEVYEQDFNRHDPDR